MDTATAIIIGVIANIIATAILVLGTSIRLGHRLGGIETKVDALWNWFLQRSLNPQIRKTDWPRNDH